MVSFTIHFFQLHYHSLQLPTFEFFEVYVRFLLFRLMLTSFAYKFIRNKAYKHFSTYKRIVH